MTTRFDRTTRSALRWIAPCLAAAALLVPPAVQAQETTIKLAHVNPADWTISQKGAAGDVFNGALAAALAEGRELLEAARFGQRHVEAGVEIDAREAEGVGRGALDDAQAVGVLAREGRQQLQLRPAAVQGRDEGLDEAHAPRSLLAREAVPDQGVDRRRPRVAAGKRGPRPEEEPVHPGDPLAAVSDVFHRTLDNMAFPQTHRFPFS